MIFYIKTLQGEADHLKGNQVWLTGESPSMELNTTLFSEIVDENKVRFRTGLNLDDIDSNYQLKTEEDKDIFKTAAKPLIEKVLRKYKEAEQGTNQYFWNPTRTELKLNSFTLDRMYDTDDVEGAILYLNILGGGYPSISPTLELAYQNFNRFYVTTAEDFTERTSQEKFGLKRKATASLDLLLEKSGIDGLVWMSYLVSHVNRGYGFNTDKATFEQIFMDYLEGNVAKVDRKTASENFYNLSELWKKDKDQLIGKGVISAAVYHGILYKPTKGANTKYINSLTSNELGTNQEQVYQKLIKPEYQQEYKEIFDAVKSKLK